MRGFYETDDEHAQLPTTIGLPRPPVGAVNKETFETDGAGVYASRPNVKWTLCRVESCNQKEYVNCIVKLDQEMIACVNKYKSGRVLTLTGASVFLYNPVLIAIGQEGGL